MNKKDGFSIIEILIVTALFSVLAFLVAQSTLSTFKGTRKIDASGKVRDNISFAADVAERHLRNAKSVLSACDAASHSSIRYVDQQGRTGAFTCYGIGGSNPYIASDSGALSQPLTSGEVTLTSCSFTCTQASAVNPPTIDFTIAGRATGVAATDESFATVTRRVVLRVY
jgi:prepilin-type N-terminal cleavage/methylation domain-containing protein